MYNLSARFPGFKPGYNSLGTQPKQPTSPSHSMRCPGIALIVALACALLLAPVNATYGAPRGSVSHARPVKYEGNTTLFSLAAALTQETYCIDSKVGMTIGDAKLLWQFGDGNVTQRSLVFHSKSLGVVLAIEGTNQSSSMSKRHIYLPMFAEPEHILQHNWPKGALVNWGFMWSYMEIVDHILPAIRDAMKKHNESRVTITGHSQGASVGLLASLHLDSVIPGGIYRSFGFAPTRMGNKAFADHVDDVLGGKHQFVVNGPDWVPHKPFQKTGYQHPSNLIWINPANSSHWLKYPGQENVHGPNSINPDWETWDNHQGVYFGTQIGAFQGHCPAKVGEDGPTTFGEEGTSKSSASTAPSTAKSSANGASGASKSSATKVPGTSKSSAGEVPGSSTSAASSAPKPRASSATSTSKASASTAHTDTTT